jgi:hypothetical protein
MDYVVIKIPSIELLTNQLIINLSSKSLSLGARVEGSEGGVTTYGNIGNHGLTYSILTYSVVKDIIDLGGNVLNYRSFIEVDLDANVPSYIREFEVIDEDGETINLSWGDWVHTNQPPALIDGKYYISGYGRYAGFSSLDKPKMHLDGIELCSLIADGYNVLNKDQFITLKESQDS